MPSPPLGSTHGRTTSGVALHHSSWTAHTVELRRAWHAIIAFEQHTRSNDVGHGITSPPLDSTHGRTTSGVTCHHRLWTAHSVKRYFVCQVIIALGQHTRSNDVRRDMPSPPLDSTHDRTTSGVACRHLVWEAHTVERCRASHAIINFGKNKRSNDVRRGITSPPLDCTHGQTT